MVSTHLAKIEHTAAGLYRILTCFPFNCLTLARQHLLGYYACEVKQKK